MRLVGADPAPHGHSSSPRHFGNSMLWPLGLFLPSEVVFQESATWRLSLPSTRFCKQVKF